MLLQRERAADEWLAKSNIRVGLKQTGAASTDALPALKLEYTAKEPAADMPERTSWWAKLLCGCGMPPAVGDATKEAQEQHKRPKAAGKLRRKRQREKM